MSKLGLAIEVAFMSWRAMMHELFYLSLTYFSTRVNIYHTCALNSLLDGEKAGDVSIAIRGKAPVSDLQNRRRYFRIAN